MPAERVIHGRIITAENLGLIQSLLRNHPHWSRSRLSRELCQLWNWRDAKENLRDIACRTLLLRLHRSGDVVLPPPRSNPHNEGRYRSLAKVPHDSHPLQSPLAHVTPLEIAISRPGSSDDALWLFLLQQYHYLGCRHVPGENLRYLVRAANGQIIACALFAAAAWKVAARDRFIGWSPEQRQTQWSRITNNARLLLLPWVQIPGLASHLLSQLCGRLLPDWEEKYGHPIHLVESFVDRSRFRGTCYRAANWLLLGRTVGRTRNDRDHLLHASVKDLYVYPLHPNFRRKLCS